MTDQKHSGFLARDPAREAHGVGSPFFAADLLTALRRAHPNANLTAMNAHFMVFTLNGVGVTLIAKDAAGTFSTASALHPQPAEFEGYKTSTKDPNYRYLDTSVFRDQILAAASSPE